MSREYSECVYNLWTGFVVKATCEAGYLNCDGLSCSMYTPKKDTKPTTHLDWIKSLSVEEVAETYAAGCPNGDRLNCGKYYLHGGRNCFNCWLDWLKAPVEEVDNGT